MSPEQYGRPELRDLETFGAVWARYLTSHDVDGIAQAIAVASPSSIRTRSERVALDRFPANLATALVAATVQCCGRVADSSMSFLENGRAV